MEEETCWSASQQFRDVSAVPDNNSSTMEGGGHYSYTTRIWTAKSEFAAQVSKYNQKFKPNQWDKLPLWRSKA
jgi:hypothetical protein